MPQKIHWTATADAGLRRLRARGVPWDAIASVLCLSRSALIRHGLRIGARGPVRPPRPDPELANPNRAPLRAGHPRSWGLLTAGTLLARTPYPWPPAGDRRQEGRADAPSA